MRINLNVSFPTRVCGKKKTPALAGAGVSWEEMDDGLIEAGAVGWRTFRP